MIASDTTSNWVSVQLPRSGDYLLYVEAKTSGGQTSHYTIGWQVQAEYVNLNGMTWHTLKGDGSKFDLGISYQSNNDVSFTWQYYDISNKEWHVIASDTTGNWITAKLPHKGQYLIYVEAKTKSGKKATASIGWQVFSKDSFGEISRIFNSSNNVMSAGYYNLVTGEGIYKNGNTLVTAASTYKLFIALYVFDLINTGQASWNTTYSSGTFMSGFYDMVVNSGNTFSEWVINHYGYTRIDSFLKRQGYSGIHNYSDRSTTNVADLVAILKYYYTHANDEKISYLLSLMMRQNFRSGIPAGTGILTADKVGFLWDIRNDAGIVYANNPYILVVMTNNQYDFSLIANISRRIQNVQ